MLGPLAKHRIKPQPQKGGNHGENYDFDHLLLSGVRDGALMAIPMPFPALLRPELQFDNLYRMLLTPVSAPVAGPRCWPCCGTRAVVLGARRTGYQFVAK